MIKSNCEKNFLSLITSVTLIIVTLCVQSTSDSFKVYALTNSEITNKLTALQSKYPSGSYWLTPNTQIYGGYQCYAFARQLAVDVFGSYPASNIIRTAEGTVSNGWTAIRTASKVTLEPGDIIRADNDSHTAMIWKIEGNNVYVAQCWGTQNNKVNWGAFWGNNKKATISELLGSGFNGVWKHPGGDKIESLNVPTIKANKESYNIDETVNISWAASPSGSNLSHYWLQIFNPDGSTYLNETMNKNTSYSFKVSQVGSYKIVVWATPIGSKEGEGSLTDTKYITVTNPATIGHVMEESEAAGRTLLDGDYWICSGYNMNYYLDIPGVEISPSGTNVWMWNYENEMPTSCDVWTVTYLNNGFYRIKQKDSSVSLDVNGGTVDRGANVQLWSDNNSNAQQWSIARTDYGYTLQARCSAFFMDIYDAGTENGTNVSTYTKNGERWQNWCFIPYNPDERPITDGIYNIQTACDSNFYVDAEGAHGKFTNETNILLYNETTDSFKVNYVGDRWYSICEASSGLSLDVYNKDPSHFLDVSMNIQLHTNNQGRNQLWKIRNTGDGHYWIISKLNGYCFDLELGAAENGTNISQYPYNGGINQKWNFIPVSLSEIVVTPPTKNSYTVGDSLDITGMKVVAKYSDTSTKDVTNSIKISGDLSTVGTRIITVSYSEGGITKTVTFKVTVNAVATSPIITTQPVDYKLGDVNNDEQINSVDASSVLAYYAKISTNQDGGYNDEQMKAADVNNDGSVNSVDASKILAYYAYVSTTKEEILSIEEYLKK